MDGAVLVAEGRSDVVAGVRGVRPIANGERGGEEVVGGQGVASFSLPQGYRAWDRPGSDMRDRAKAASRSAGGDAAPLSPRSGNRLATALPTVGDMERPLVTSASFIGDHVYNTTGAPLGAGLGRLA